MTANAAVGIDDDFPSGESSVAMRSADDETAGRIDMEFGLRIHHPGRDDRINNVFFDISAELIGAHIIAMLRGDDHGVDAAGLSIHVFNADLAFSVRPEIGQFAGAARLAE